MLMTKYARGRVMEGGNEQDDAGCIIWALGDFFFSLSFLLLTKIL